MGLRELLNEKISTEMQQTPEYKLLLNLIKKEKIQSTEGLRHYIAAEIKRNKDCLTECCKAGTTSNRKRAKETRNIDFLELIQRKILPRLA